ncbi:MAG: methionine gamma-lyase family protein [Clostridia bacterium]|nr:methionine gamma-lyase family protein [Clostridia bacterium]
MFDFDKKIYEYSETAMKNVESEFQRIDKITEFNQQKMLKAFIDNNVSESMFSGTTGYGYSDRGRETLDKVLAEAMGAEDAIIRHNFTCGTHTLSVALFGVLRPGDTMLCVTGTPYDTIHPVIGLSGESGMGSLKDFGVIYKQVDLKEDGTLDYDSIEKAVDDGIAMVYIQRSRGYSLRPSLSVDEIEKVVKITKKKSNAVVMVDNCYGEWVEKREPTQVGADLIAGSLIKNPGGGIARTGGYIAGRHDLIEKCAARLITPGIGREVGCTLGMNRELFLGVYSAPHVVGEALKSMAFAAALFKLIGFDSTPASGEERHDIIQAIKLHNEKNLIAFCRGIQKCSPVDAFATPEPWDMPGYDSKVIMAAGAFTLGSSIELSADAPLREPYAVWMQGGLNFHSAKLAIMSAADEVFKIQ